MRPNSVTSLNRTPTFELYMVRCGLNNGYKKDMSLKEIGLHAQNMSKPNTVEPV